MAYNTPPTKSVGDTLTAAEWNTYVRDNMAAGVPDLFTAQGDLVVASAANVAAVLPASYNHYVLESTGVGGALQWTATVPQCRIHKSTTQSIPDNTLTEIAFDSEDADTDGFYPGSGNSITLPSTAIGSGLYAVNCRGIFDGHATDAKLRQVGIYISGTYVNATFVQDADGTATSVSINELLYLGAGTVLRMVVHQISGGSLNFNSANMAVVRIR